MRTPLNRRQFLKFTMLAAGGLFPRSSHPYLPADDQQPPLGWGRVTIAYLRVYSQPSYKSNPVGWRRRDEILPIHEEVISASWPVSNARWYRITNGYAHSAYIQRLDDAQLNPPAKWVPEKGQLGELTVPFSDSLRPLSRGRWEPLYRLYYHTIHWVTGILEGPDREPWYQLTDELLHVRYAVPAAHIRLVSNAEYTPLATDVPDSEKRIEVSLREQVLTAYEGDQVVLRADVSSGIPTSGPSENGIPTDTPAGKFNVALKMPSKHMGDGELTSDYQAYELLGVPWNCFFVSTGVAFHGTYWHDNFGQRMSHGCVNMRNENALWLFRWTTPVIHPGEWFAKGRGTAVHVY
jgi:lipoprotein-anchoring transpeptidase ErfK/SrfK